MFSRSITLQKIIFHVRLRSTIVEPEKGKSVEIWETLCKTAFSTITNVAKNADKRKQAYKLCYCDDNYLFTSLSWRTFRSRIARFSLHTTHGKHRRSCSLHFAQCGISYLWSHFAIRPWITFETFVSLCCKACTLKRKNVLFQKHVITTYFWSTESRWSGRSSWSNLPKQILVMQGYILGCNEFRQCIHLLWRYCYSEYLAKFHIFTIIAPTANHPSVIEFDLQT